MIRLARIWYNFIADYHGDRALDHARRRDRALRRLERLERGHRQRETQREIGDILARPRVRSIIHAGDIPPRVHAPNVRVIGYQPRSPEDCQ